MTLARILHLGFTVRIHAVNASVLDKLSAAVEGLVINRLRLASTNQEEAAVRSLAVLEVERELLVYLHLQFIESFVVHVKSQHKLRVSF